MNPGRIIEEGAKVAGTAIEAMRSVPLAVALLLVNVGFLGVAVYVLGEVAANASERNKSQLELINNLVRDCRQPATSLELPLLEAIRPPISLGAAFPTP